MGWWRPRGFTLDNFSSEDDVPYISTPRSWPIWTAAVPTPPATAWMRTRGVRGESKAPLLAEGARNGAPGLFPDAESKSPPFGRLRAGSCRIERDKDGAPISG